jgi:hypothetical protein
VEFGGASARKIAADERGRRRKKISAPHFPFPTVFAPHDVLKPHFGDVNTPKRTAKRRFH